jgi:hypothetical protein
MPNARSCPAISNNPVGVNDVEAADGILHRAELVDEGTAHVVDFVHEVWVQG